MAYGRLRAQRCFGGIKGGGRQKEYGKEQRGFHQEHRTDCTGGLAQKTYLRTIYCHCDCLGRNEAEIDPIELFARRKDFHATSSILQHIVTEHNDYLATWKGPSQKAPNWEGLMGEGHYIRAVQFLQDAECPYHSDKDYERVLVEIIEGNKLIVYDEWYIHISQQCEIL